MATGNDTPDPNKNPPTKQNISNLAAKLKRTAGSKPPKTAKQK